jgi:sporulation protein YlmC with PRC-barrel domain
MKNSLKWLAICAASAFLTQGALAHDQSKGQSQNTQNQKTFRASQLIGKTAKDSQGQDVGKLNDIVINPQNNEIFGVVDLGDNRYAPVPWQLFQVTRDNSGSQQLSLSSTKDNLKAAPTVSKDQFSNLSQSSFTERIYG